MTREQFWCEVFLRGGSFENADDCIIEYDKRFSPNHTHKYTLDNLPSWDEICEGCDMEGVHVEAYYSSEGTFMIRFKKNGNIHKIYSNKRTEKDAKFWYDDMALELLQDGLIAVDDLIDH